MKRIKLSLKIIILSILFCSKIFAETKTDSTIFFPDLFLGFEDLNQATNVFNNSSASKSDLRKAGIQFFLAGTQPDLNKKEMTSLLKKSVVVLEKSWAQDKLDNRIRILLAYSYTAYCGANISIEDIMRYIFKARNLFSLVIAKLPQNIDARLGRIRINVSMPAGTSRPDDILIDDSKVFIENFKLLSIADKNSFYFKQGLSEANLALAIVYDYRNQKDNARENFLKIDTKLLTTHTKKIYQVIASKYE
jgi:hypothetical protein